MGWGFSCQIKFAVVNFAAGNFTEAPGFWVVKFADSPRNVVICRALQPRWSLATGANFAEEAGFCMENFAAHLKRELSHTNLTAPETPAPPLPKKKAPSLQGKSRPTCSRMEKNTSFRGGLSAAKGMCSFGELPTAFYQQKPLSRCRCTAAEAAVSGAMRGSVRGSDNLATLPLRPHFRRWCLPSRSESPVAVLQRADAAAEVTDNCLMLFYQCFHLRTSTQRGLRAAP